MSNVKTVRVGQMPGQIKEFAVAEGSTIKSVLDLASLNASGYEVKVDGSTVDANTAVVTSSTALILLTKQVKGNAVKTVRVGKMPGQINEYAVNEGDTIASVLSLAGLNASGYEVKVDGTTSSVDSKVTSSTTLILLTKQVKGNNVKTVRVGKMPGQINEYAVNEGDTIASVLTLAGLSAAGYEVKVDGTTSSTDSKVTSSTTLILLTKQVKGNADVKTVRVGKMPGQINEYAVEVGSTVKELLALAGLSAAGYEIKVDGTTSSESATITSSTTLVLLTKQVKGN